MRKRKAALALSAGAMGITSAAMALPAAAPAGPVLSMPLPEVRRPAALLSASEALKESLIQEEGVRDVVYRDIAGHPTVGVGHLVHAADGLKVGDRVSYDRILDFLEDDLREAERGAARLVGSVPLLQHEFDALVDLVFNVGEGNVSPERSPRLNEAIAARDYEEMARELQYTHAAGVPANGLVYRSERRSKIFLDAAYADPRDQA